MTAVRPGELADDTVAELSVEVAEAVAVAHRVAVLAETDSGAPLVVAMRAALEVADARRTARRDRRVAGWEVHGGHGAWWACWAEQWMPHTELAALRATPGPTTSPAPEPDVEPGNQASTGVDVVRGAR